MGGPGVGLGGRGGCERRIEVFVKNPKKIWGGPGGSGGSGWGVRVDVNEELKFFWKFKKKNWGGGVGGGGGRRGRGRDQGGCERRIEVFVKIQKKMGGPGGRGRVGGSEWI